MLNEHEPVGNELIRAVELLADAFSSRSIRDAIVGGLAALVRGRPRFTQDVDVLLDVPQLALPGLLEDLHKAGFAFDMATVIRQYVREHITVLRFGMVRIDWLKPVLPLYARTLADASLINWPAGRQVRFATAEGLVLTKMAAFRPQDQLDLDIEILLSANRDTIDLTVVRGEWSAVAAEDDTRTVWLESAIARLVAPQD